MVKFIFCLSTTCKKRLRTKEEGGNVVEVPVVFDLLNRGRLKIVKNELLPWGQAIITLVRSLVTPQLLNQKLSVMLDSAWKTITKSQEDGELAYRRPQNNCGGNSPLSLSVNPQLADVDHQSPAIVMRSTVNHPAFIFSQANLFERYSRCNYSFYLMWQWIHYE